MSEFDDGNGIMKQWVAEATAVVYDQGWRDAPTNAVLLLCNDMGRKRDLVLVKIIRGPVRLFTGVCASGLIWWIVRDLILALPV